MSNSSTNATKHVEEWELRRIFNELDIVGQAERGELHTALADDRPAPSSIWRYINGTRSQMIHYLDADNKLIAKAHRYIRPDGLLAGGGKADPKRTLCDGVWYILDPKIKDAR